MWQQLLDLVLPPRCGGCLSLGAWYCAQCRQRTRRLAWPLCRRCGSELSSERAYCGCRLQHAQRIRSVAALEGPLESAMHRFKYSGWRRLAAPLAELLASAVLVDGMPGELVLAVPLHHRRERLRGFNQAQLLVDHLRPRLQLQSPPGRLLRVRETPPQVGLDRRRRLVNLAGAFRWQGEILKREPVIVVDDVSTTGATIDACAAALKAAGAGPVFGLTVARVGS